MIDVIKLHNDIETLKNDLSKALSCLDGEAPNLHSMRALVACHDLLPYLSALIALQYGQNGERVTELPEVDIDPIGAELPPGDMGLQEG